MAVTVRAPFPAGTAGDIVATSTTITTSVTLLAGDDLELHTGYDKGSDSGVTLSAKLDPTGSNLSPDGSSIIVHANGATVGFEQVFWWLNSTLTPLLGAGAKNVTVTASTSADSMEQKAYAITGADHNAPTVTTATGSSASAAVTSASCPANGLAIGHFVGGSSFTATNNTNTLNQSGTSGNAGWNIAGNTAAGAGATISLTGTLPSDFWGAIATVWAPAGAAGAAPPPARTQRWSQALVGSWPRLQFAQAVLFVPPGTVANADVAQATGTAYFDPTGGSISLNLIADSPIDAVGTAYNATISTVPHTNASAGNAAGTGTANNPQPSIAPTSGVATGSGTANNTTSQVKPGPTAATGTGTANNTTSLVSTTPATATGTGSSLSPAPSVAPGMVTATGTGSAFNPTISTNAFTNAAAGVALGTGTSNNPTCTISTVVPTAAGAGTAANSSPSVAPSTGNSTGTGVANNTTSKVAPGAQVATGSGTVFAPTIQTGSFVNVNASLASATGTANNVSAKISPTPSTAVATGTSNNPSITRAVFAQAGLAAATGTALATSLSIRAAAQASTALAIALDATVGTGPATLEAIRVDITGGPAVSRVTTGVGVALVNTGVGNLPALIEGVSN
jgi:hypothetical protein